MVPIQLVHQSLLSSGEGCRTRWKKGRISGRMSWDIEGRMGAWLDSGRYPEMKREGITCHVGMANLAASISASSSSSIRRSWCSSSHGVENASHWSTDVKGERLANMPSQRPRSLRNAGLASNAWWRSMTMRAWLVSQYDPPILSPGIYRAHAEYRLP